MKQHKLLKLLIYIASFGPFGRCNYYNLEMLKPLSMWS